MNARTRYYARPELAHHLVLSSRGEVPFDDDVNVDVPSVQRAIRRLREGTPSLVWKSARGEYAPQDSGMHDWYDALVARNAWPPDGAHAIDDDVSGR